MDKKPPLSARLLLVFVTAVLFVAGLQFGMALGDFIVAHKSNVFGVAIIVSLIGLVGGLILKLLKPGQG